MNYIYQHTNSKILKLGIRMALYREKKPGPVTIMNGVAHYRRNVFEKFEASRIAYLKKPEFKDKDEIYYIKSGEKLIIDGFINKELQKQCSHYYPGQQVESFKYVEEVLQNWCQECDKAHVDFKCPECGDSTYYVDKLSWQEVEEPVKVKGNIGMKKPNQAYTQFKEDVDKGIILAEINT